MAPFASIPTNAGGKVEITNNGSGKMTLYAHDGTTELVKQTTMSSIDLLLSPSNPAHPTHGRYYVLVIGPSPRKVTSKFTQTALARDGTSDKDPPLFTHPEDHVAKPPAYMSSGYCVTFGSSVANRKSYHVLHIAFDAKTGKVDVPTQEKSMESVPMNEPDPDAATKTKHRRSDAILDDRSRWKKCRSATGDIYVPSLFWRVEPTATTVPPGARLYSKQLKDEGNPIIDLDLSHPPKNVLQIRKRYRK